MIVVSNTSPLTNLAAIGQFNLLKKLYSTIHIAEGVWEELNAQGKHWPGREEVAKSDWVKRYEVKNQKLVNALRQDLDRGEAESIVLSLELNADLIILDEKEGRHTAQRFDLKVVGVIGALLEAKSKGFISNIRPHLDELREIAGFYVKESLYQSIINLADELKI
ncbi:MAG: DUF3368 domain-containing protein [Thermodesulfobacteriota bacterium]|nr:DUF3368 domain-containing protein [Thermodesulfobacteriota bacterium]